MNTYELWEDFTGEEVSRLFVRTDHNGDRLRAKLKDTAEKTWTVEAETHYHAMVAYWKHMNRGEFTAVDHIFPGEEL